MKERPGCRSRIAGQFPDDMPGPLQHGADLQAFVIDLSAAQMLCPAPGRQPGPRRLGRRDIRGRLPVPCPAHL